MHTSRYLILIRKLIGVHLENNDLNDRKCESYVKNDRAGETGAFGLNKRKTKQKMCKKNKKWNI
jgi:hypothetical protein